MSPDQIYAFVKSAYPELEAIERHRPDGYAFYYGPKSNGNRIFRAVQSGPTAVTKLKLAQSSMRAKSRGELSFTGGEDELRVLIAKEIAIFSRTGSLVSAAQTSRRSV